MEARSRRALSIGAAAVALTFAAAGNAVPNGPNPAQAAAQAQAQAKVACAKAKAAAKAKAPTAAKAKAACVKATLKAAAAANAAAAATTPAQSTVVTVSAFEMGFKLSSTVVPHGTVIFKVVNDGKVPHDFRIGRQGTETLDSGQAATLTANLATPGKYTFLCTVEGHAGAGMIGTFTVK